MPREPSFPLKVFIAAGEASGDALGARLMYALKMQYRNEVEFYGVGGAQMEAEGLDSIFSMHELSVMGIVEILPRIRAILARIRHVAAEIHKVQPHIVITIDSPDFSFRVAKETQKHGKAGAKWVHYVAPTVWAWRPERAKKVAALYDGLICLFPFEPPYFTAEGMSAAFTGHPALENLNGLDGSSFRHAHNVPPEAFVIGALFGSRVGELKRMGAVLRDAIADALKTEEAPESIHIVAPTLPHLKDRVDALLKDMPCPVHVTVDPSEKWATFAAMDAAVATSGTVGLELAVAGVPHAIGYRANWLTWHLVRPRIRVKYAHLANILLDRMVAPEFLQDECTAENLSGALASLFDPAGPAAVQKESFTQLVGKLHGADEGLPSEQAARYVLGLGK